MIQRRTFIGIPSFLNDSLNALNRKVYSETKIMGFSQKQMFDIISDVAKYEEFVPWCHKSIVYDHTKTIIGSDSWKKLVHQSKNLQSKGPYYQKKMKADLVVGFKDISERYTSHVTCLSPLCVEAISRDSRLFKYLKNTWKLTPAIPHTLQRNSEYFKNNPHLIENFPFCIIDFFVEFEFHSSLYASVSSIYMSQVANKMIESFENRAIQLFVPSNASYSSNKASISLSAVSIEKLLSMNDFKFSKEEISQIQTYLISIHNTQK